MAWLWAMPRPDVKLDKFQKAGLLSYEMGNTSYLIDLYLQATPPKWAILTDGNAMMQPTLFFFLALRYPRIHRTRLLFT